MSVSLLDVNVLIALFWKVHPHHQLCKRWFDEHSGDGWATCPITEAGCARIMSNPAFDEHAPAFSEVVRLLQKTALSNKAHQFWTADLSLSALESQGYLRIGHQQITDAYLLALAVSRKGKLVTTDKRMRTLVAAGTAEANALVILS